jgi:hypothetical protein
MSLPRYLLNTVIFICISTFVLSQYTWAGEHRGTKVDLDQGLTAYIEIAELNAMQRQTLKEAKTISVVVHQVYKYEKNKQIDGYTLPFKEVTVQSFKRLGVLPATDSPNKIMLEIEGIAIPLRYTDKQLRYTAARVKGSLTLTLAGASALNASFEMENPGMSSVPTFWVKSPSFAPFSSAYHVYTQVILDIIGQAFGWDSLLPIVQADFDIPNPFRPLGDGKGDGPVGNRPSISGMKQGPVLDACNVILRSGKKEGVSVLTDVIQHHQNIEVRQRALYALRMAKVLVPLDLIYPLFADKKMSRGAAEYLQAITGGEYFGDDVAKWKAWIAANPQIFKQR